MRRGRWRWYVFGAQAVVVYGRPRMTADVDVTVDAAPSASSSLVAALGKFDFVLRFPLASDFAGHFLPMRHEPTGMPVDITLARPGLHQEFLARCRRVDVGGARIPVISVEDLVAIKTLAGRRKDIEDIHGILLERKAKLDFARIQTVLRALEAATGDTRLRRRLERIVSRVDTLLGRPKRR